MAIGIYIHVPFCLKKCNYCDFVSYPYDADLAASYVYALEKEMSYQLVNMGSEHREVKSIYLGGGTPTVLTGEQLAAILENCRKSYQVADDAEITVECNPGTVNPDKLGRIRKAGANRVSIGVQAYQQELLARLGRIHNWQEVESAVRHSRQAGFDNVSLDLIFGIPGQSMRQWRDTLDRVLALSPQHISAYNLKIEPDTPLHRDVCSGYLIPCDEELELEMYWYVIGFLTGNGFVHYEISNFARPGREARHNLIYWRNEEYLGFGPAAHSMLEGRRFSNVEKVELYINRLNRNESGIQNQQYLSREERISETVFLGLRLIEGLDLDAFKQSYGQSIFEIFAVQLKRLSSLGLVKIEDNRLKLTEKGLPLANEVFAEFI
ncbi:MAG: radical SAM family heme chaperone HemW [Eubacteriales bacterium]